MSHVCRVLCADMSTPSDNRVGFFPTGSVFFSTGSGYIITLGGPCLTKGVTISDLCIVMSNFYTDRVDTLGYDPHIPCRVTLGSSSHSPIL